VQGARCKVQGARCKVQGARCKVQGARHMAQGTYLVQGTILYFDIRTNPIYL
jgi:hypothetical protein